MMEPQIKVGNRAFFHVAGSTYPYMLTEVISEKEVKAVQVSSQDTKEPTQLGASETYTLRRNGYWIEKGKSGPAHRHGYLTISYRMVG